MKQENWKRIKMAALCVPAAITDKVQPGAEGHWLHFECRTKGGIAMGKEYVLVLWPEVQDLMDYPWFDEECHLLNPLEDMEQYNSTYFVPKIVYSNWKRTSKYSMCCGIAKRRMEKNCEISPCKTKSGSGMTRLFL